MSNRKQIRNKKPKLGSKKPTNKKSQSQRSDAFKIQIVEELEEIKTDNRTLRLAFKNDKGEKTKFVKIDVARSILNSANDLHKVLLAKGYRGNKKIVQGQLHDLIAYKPDTTIPATRQTGLIKGALVTRYTNLAIPSPEGKTIKLVNHIDSPPPKARRRGTTDRNLKCFEFLLASSTELTFAYLVALAAPLGALLGSKDGFIGLVYGETSTGKTSMLRLAQSLSTCATHDKHLDGFENTPGRLLKSTIQTAGLVRCFGDVKSSRDGVNFDDFRTYGYSITEGRYRQPMDDVSANISLDYSIQLYATEEPLWKMYSKRKEKFQRSDLIRLVHIPIAGQEEGGVFRRQPQKKWDRCFEKLDATIAANYGCIMPEWFKQLETTDVDGLKKKYRKWMKESFVEIGGTEKEKLRIARIFRFLQFVAKLADKKGLLPINYTTAVENLNEQYDRVVACGPEAQKSSNTTDKLLNNILWAAASFPEVVYGKKACYKIEEIGGFKRKEPDGKFYLYVHSSFLNWFDENQKSKIRDALKRLSGQDETKPIKQKGIEKRPRCYVIPISKLKREASELETDANEFVWSR